MLYEYQAGSDVEEFGQIQYSQFGEDVVIWHLLESAGKLDQGFYVDVGAHHPRRMSNTKLLHKYKGWTGINIEPDPSLFEQIAAERTSDINLNIGCASQPGTLELTIFNHPAANTMNAEMAAYQSKHSYMEVRERRSVPVLPLKDVLSEHVPAGREIGLLSIDAEGLDEEILMTADLERWRPFVLCIEDHAFDPANPQQSKAFNYLTSLGYYMNSKVRVSLIFVRGS